MVQVKRGAKMFYTTLLVILIFSALTLSVLEYFSEEQYVKIDDISVVDDTVILSNNCTALVAQTSPERALSIKLGLENRMELRPNTHDIFSEVLDKFNITLERVTIDNLNEGIYYANLHLKKYNDVLKIDLKPSDGIALALRTDSPIYIKDWILKESGQNTC